MMTLKSVYPHIIIEVKIYCVTTQRSCISLPLHYYLMDYTDLLSPFP